MLMFEMLIAPVGPPEVGPQPWRGPLLVQRPSTVLANRSDCAHRRPRPGALNPTAPVSRWLACSALKSASCSGPFTTCRPVCTMSNSQVTGASSTLPSSRTHRGMSPYSQQALQSAEQSLHAPFSIGNFPYLPMVAWLLTPATLLPFWISFAVLPVIRAAIAVAVSLGSRGGMEARRPVDHRGDGFMPDVRRRGGQTSICAPVESPRKPVTEG